MDKTTDIIPYLTGDYWRPHPGYTRARPTRHEVARLAFDFYEARGRRDGYDLEDWLSAEQQLNRHFR